MFQDEVSYHSKSGGISVSGQDFGISHMVRFLASNLGQVISDQEGTEALSLVENIRSLCKELRTKPEARIAEELALIISRLSLEQLNLLTKAFTHYFGLINLAEKLDLLAQVRETILKDPEIKREGSLPSAIRILREQGVPAKNSSPFWTRPRSRWSLPPIPPNPNVRQPLRNSTASGK